MLKASNLRDLKLFKACISDYNRIIIFLKEIFRMRERENAEELNFGIRINNRTQKLLTFENDYLSDFHLVKAVDYLATKIMKAEEFNNQRQTRLKSFTGDIGT